MPMIQTEAYICVYMPARMHACMPMLSPLYRPFTHFANICGFNKSGEDCDAHLITIV